jgi:hypothetical protein
MPPRIAIFVRGGLVQEVPSDTPDVLIKVLDMDVLEERETPDEWAAPDIVIPDPQDFETYTSGATVLIVKGLVDVRRSAPPALATASGA